ncbi:MAG TPA: 30S ribosomal protein S6 [Candidatus Dojkabacteria bacterium]|nr:30S ribosomal protein S6 [Candidatus Dojkabacteria bacterium]HRO65281.1 30S ribosomal protein S6 [Candidatus Dojkabacteria bacterium]HRP36202.1 30S ribosomal protein S6 [Candidatus Dojkabacteria bacterium]HRP51572.1 30S ribosomal protein S6 [Candidatus Dojkabacteria bacterium]
MKYELMLILKPMLTEDIRANVLKKIDEYVTKAGGKITKEDIWGKRHLAYIIEGNEEGYYVVYNLELDKSKVTELQNKLKFMNDILRFLLVLED